MNLHEYQSKNILRSFNISVPNSKTVSTLSEVDFAFDQFKTHAIAIKAQVHAGGRGKSGGVKIINTKKEAHDFAELWLGSNLITYQNSPQGQPVHRLLMEETVDIASEVYFSIVVDRQNEGVTIICSNQGGMDIEVMTTKNPQLIKKLNFKLHQQPSNVEIENFYDALCFRYPIKDKFVEVIQNSINVFLQNDLSLLEINPLVITKKNELIALDCKMSIDDNSLFKHPEFQDLHDWSQIDSKEAEAHHAGLNYIALEGNIGCMVNGAGLAMATMDLIKLCGGEPANFLDVGGGASSETVSKAFKILLSDENVTVVLVNIFGGIMRCDIIASGIVDAVKEVGIEIPIVVRLEGTNVELGKQILNESKLNITTAKNLHDAAVQSVKLSKEI
ncbi:MAG: ADP-forming succinate--CoA ligase subunit beta [Methylophilaceae bacterium]